MSAVATDHPVAVTLLLGGARSGKSQLAEKLALARFRRPLYLATAEACDDEMRARIAHHRARRGARWACAEEPLDLAGALERAEPACDGVVVECLTTWLGNVLHHEKAAAWERRRTALLALLERPLRPVILVSNEVGLGIVPASELGRDFRDLAGRCHQEVAQRADEVALVVAGLPLWLKRPGSGEP